MDTFEGLLLLPSGDGCAWVPGRLTVAGGRIASIERRGVARGARMFAPGLVDLHVHGFGGWGPVVPTEEARVAWERAGNDPALPIGEMARALARAGTTSFQPTLFPGAPGALNATLRAVGDAAGKLGAAPGAHVLGVHLEGPFVNPLAAGALPPEDLAAPSPAALDTLLDGLDEVHGVDALTGAPTTLVRTMTVAPELPGAPDLIHELVRRGIRPSLGHSRATAAEARAPLHAHPSLAFGVTHLYNAMSGVHHRDPGLAHLALCEGSLFAELIGDLVHVGREGVELALAALGPARLCLVSDALAGAGTGCDAFHSHGRAHVIRGGAAYYPGEPPQLAGSASSQWEMVVRLVSEGVLALGDALTMATLAPARALGLEHEVGTLSVGARADLLELEATEAGPELRGVWVAGRDAFSTH